jgi:hypothetical protein
MSDAQAHEFFERQLEWCRTQRAEAERALDLYERGVMRFKINNVDVTEGQKASLRNIIENMDSLIARIEADAEGA